MTNTRNALIIGSEVAVNGFESGASLRLHAVRKVLEGQGFSATIVARSAFKTYLNQEWDAVALTSFATAKCARKARKATPLLWFDSTDSWNQTRRSLIRQGYYLQFFAYARDLFFIWTAPHFDLITFITERDRHAERLWWGLRAKPLVFPISNLDQKIGNSVSNRLVFVGDGNYFPNQQALKYLENLDSRLSTDLPIHVFGRGFDSAHPRFVCHGYVPSDMIYEANDIHLAPIFSGAGLKLKVAIPAWNGLRVVTTPEGANGFARLNQIAIGCTPIEFIEKIENFLKMPLTVSRITPRETIFEVDETWLVKSRISHLI